MQGPCSACGGTGKTFKNEYLKTIKEKISITIEKGMCNGEQIILKNKGNFNVNSMKNNDLVFVIIERSNQYYVLLPGFLFNYYCFCETKSRIDLLLFLCIDFYRCFKTVFLLFLSGKTVSPSDALQTTYLYG